MGVIFFPRLTSPLECSPGNLDDTMTAAAIVTKQTKTRTPTAAAVSPARMMAAAAAAAAADATQTTMAVAAPSTAAAAPIASTLLAGARCREQRDVGGRQQHLALALRRRCRQDHLGIG